MIGIGCDLVEIVRMERAVGEDHLLTRILTPAERTALQDAGQPAQWLAGRWAAKEAVAKALGCGLAGCPRQEVEVLPGSEGRRCVRLMGTAAQSLRQLGGREVLVSISHDGGYALAYAAVQ